MPLLIRIPTISNGAGKAGSSWRLGSGWQLSVLTPSYSPKTPPSRHDLFVTCFASQAARRANSSDLRSNHTGKVQLQASTKAQTESKLKSKTADIHTRAKLPPEAESAGFTGGVLERNTSFRLPRWHGRAAHSYADDLAQTV